MSSTEVSSNALITNLEEQGRGTFWEYLGCRPVQVTAHEAIAELDILPHHLNVMGVLHGGVYASLLDSVMGVLAMVLRPGLPVVTSNLNLHFTAPATSDKIRAVAHLVCASKRTLTVEGRVTDADDRLCAYATGTFRVLRVDGPEHDG